MARIRARGATRAPRPRGGVDPGQVDLFADDWQQAAATPEPKPVAPAGFGGTPDLVPQVLNDITAGVIGQLERSGRVVVLDGDGRCRHADDDVATVVESLVKQRYAAEGEFTTQLHGVIRKNVYVVALTNSGQAIRARWSNLRSA
ncbi:hypothetical protein ACFYOT_13860 [Saccharothrix saharensis]|uniref:hypothetical protein n=1 Tax=Saccharothrix saharensis TaxID=571190 RepID=UPI003681AAFC